MIGILLTHPMVLAYGCAFHVYRAKYIRYTLLPLSYTRCLIHGTDEGARGQCLTSHHWPRPSKELAAPSFFASFNPKVLSMSLVPNDSLMRALGWLDKVWQHLAERGRVIPRDLAMQPGILTRVRHRPDANAIQLIVPTSNPSRYFQCVALF